jgi:hypothetical protein
MKTKKESKENKIKKPVTIDYENKRLSIFYFLPLLLIAGFVPLIVHAKYIDLSNTAQALYWTGQEQYMDFFSYWKSRWIIVLTATALIFYAILYKQKKLPFKNLKQYYVPMGIYGVFVIISTIFAIDTQTAMWGFVDMYQGMFVLLSYVIITFLVINYVNSERDVNLFVNAFLFLMIVEGFIGVGQYFGFDFFQTKLGNSLIVPFNMAIENLSFTFGPKTIYGTLFNTNFVGSFAALMLPLSIGIFFSAKTRNKKIVSGIAVLLMIFTWIGCNSRAGYLGAAVGALFGIWLFRKMLVKHWKVSVGLVAAVLVTAVGLNAASDGALVNRLASLNITNAINNSKTSYGNDYKFKDIILGKNAFSIETNKQILNFKVENDKIYFMDENFDLLEITTSSNNIKINNNTKYWQLNNISIPQNYPGVTVKSYWDQTIDFYITEESVKILGSGGRLIEPLVAKRYEKLDGYEIFMSGRGYIWSRTIPMLKTYFIKGSGADNYPMAFPQDDFVAKLRNGSDASLVIDKPHNMYLQIAVNTGVLSLLALLAVWCIYIISSLKLYSKISFDSTDKFIGVSCLLGVIGYLIAAVFNDSITSVAPIFWIMLGMGISINIRLKKKIL